MQREWRPVVGYEGRYEVSDDGQVRSLDVPPPPGAKTGQRGKRARVMKQTRAGKGYWTVVLSRGYGREQRRFYVHRMMAAAFFGPSTLDVRHLDGNRDNNVVGNLEYGNQSLNERDKIRNGNHHQLSKTHCKHGHEFTEANTRRANGHRYCRECGRAAQRAYNARKRVKV